MVINKHLFASLPVFALLLALSAAGVWAQTPNLDQRLPQPPSSAAKAAAQPGQWVLVTAPAFAGALAPLVEQRRADGFKVTVLETTNVLSREQIRAGDAAPLRERLRELFGASAGPNYLLLAGAGVGPGAAFPEDVMVPPLSAPRRE